MFISVVHVHLWQLAQDCSMLTLPQGATLCLLVHEPGALKAFGNRLQHTTCLDLPAVPQHDLVCVRIKYS